MFMLICVFIENSQNFSIYNINSTFPELKNRIVHLELFPLKALLFYCFMRNAIIGSTYDLPNN